MTAIKGGQGGRMDMRRWFVVAVAVAVGVGLVLTLGIGGSDEPAPGGPGAAPPQATETAAAVFTGDETALRTALSPALAALLPADLPEVEPPSQPVKVTLVDWYEQDVYATATAVLESGDSQTEMTVGFRLVDGLWKITFTAPGRL